MGLRTLNPTQLYGVAPRPMYVCCLLCAWVGLEPYVETNVLSLILLIPLAELMNQKRVSIDTVFCTPYDSGPCSPMMLESQSLRLVYGPMRWKLT